MNNPYRSYHIIPILFCVWIIIQSTIIIKNGKRFSKSLYLASIACLTTAILEMLSITFTPPQYIFIRILYQTTISLIIGIWSIIFIPVLGIISIILPIVTFVLIKLYFKMRSVKIEYVDAVNFTAMTNKLKEQESLGQGQYCSVYNIRDKNDIVVKICKANSKSHMEQDIKSLNIASILNIGPKLYKVVVLLDSLDNNDVQYIVYVEKYCGGSLSYWLYDLLKRVVNKQMSLDNALQYLTSVNDKIKKDCDTAHAYGVFVTDMRSVNIMALYNTNNKLPRPSRFHIIDWNIGNLSIFERSCKKIKIPEIFNILYTNFLNFNNNDVDDFYTYMKNNARQNDDVGKLWTDVALDITVDGRQGFPCSS